MKNKIKLNKYKKNIILLITLIIFLFLYFKFSRDKTFSIIVLPDTQNYSKKYPEIFCNQTDWIINNKEKLNIVFVSQLGDIVDSGNKDIKEWQRASDCMSKLDGKIPYSIIPGNHDSEKVSDKSSGFNTYNIFFPVSRFNTNNWYKGNFNENQNSYQSIDVAGKNFLFLNLEVEPSNEYLKWAQSIIDLNPDSYTILTTHKYLHDNKPELNQTRYFSKDGNTGQDIWDKLVKNNCSIKMVWSGHYHDKEGENKLTTKNSCEEDVYQIIQDYQARENGGNGLLRIYTFDLEKNIIKVSTYSPFSDKYEEDDNSKFILEL